MKKPLTRQQRVEQIARDEVGRIAEELVGMNSTMQPRTLTGRAERFERDVCAMAVNDQRRLLICIAAQALLMAAVLDEEKERT